MDFRLLNLATVKQTLPERTIYTLQQNELYLQDSKIGFFEPKDGPINFLSIEKTEKSYPISPATRFNSNILLPSLSASFQLSKSKLIYEREAYSFLSLLGDFGGFTDALALIIGIFASRYSARMFIAATAAELPHDEGGYAKEHQRNAFVKL